MACAACTADVAADVTGEARRWRRRLCRPLPLRRMRCMSEHILLVEDDPRLAEMLQEYLGQAGLRVSHAALGATALELLRGAATPFNAVILDLMLPDMDGLDVCRRLRATHDTPVLMLTARGDAIDRIVGLELGADDYLPKPFEPRELLARLRALLRRAGPRRADEDVLRFGRLDIDRGA